MKEKTIDYMLAGITLICFSLYFFTNRPYANPSSLKIFLDDLIPLVPAFIIPYMSFHFFLIPVTTFGVYKHRSHFDFRVFLTSTIIILLISNLSFMIFPVKLTLRPLLEDTDTFSRWLALLYEHDGLYACCPSIHANISMLCALAWLTIPSAYSLIMVIWSFLVLVSTVLIRQHYFLDIFVGSLMVPPLYRLAHTLVAKYLNPASSKLITTIEKHSIDLQVPTLK